MVVIFASGERCIWAGTFVCFVHGKMQKIVPIYK